MVAIITYIAKKIAVTLKSFLTSKLNGVSVSESKKYKQTNKWKVTVWKFEKFLLKPVIFPALNTTSGITNINKKSDAKQLIEIASVTFLNLPL